MYEIIAIYKETVAQREISLPPIPTKNTVTFVILEQKLATYKRVKKESKFRNEFYKRSWGFEDVVEICTMWCSTLVAS